MKESTINKKVTTVQVELDANDLDFIITEHFKRLYNAKTSEITIDLSQLIDYHPAPDFLMYVNYHREEVC